uniref:Calmodulin-lysine N-methyltransferase n=1 Tax=Octactis speculum TaxID=3111310 RepID=A0A7S2ATK2_9STRA|mmetsp:Transcript_15385/g.20665  ORF Transcript_15385/g.20665 Transcript_15385/m.20665 type:complete len:169 (+) Transcript_15385:370-876(+)
MATDYASAPLRLVEVAASMQARTQPPPNEEEEEEEDASLKIRTALFDICDQDVPLPPADLVVAADVMYEPKTGRAMAVRTAEAVARGSRVIVGCSPGRPGREAFVETLLDLLPREALTFVDVRGETVSGPRHPLICGSGSTSVSVEGSSRPVMVNMLDTQEPQPQGGE